MQFRDQVLRCAATGREFVWTVAEQRERARNGLPLDPPLYCPEVRAADTRLADPYDKPVVVDEPVVDDWTEPGASTSDWTRSSSSPAIAARAGDHETAETAARDRGLSSTSTRTSDGSRGRSRGHRSGRTRGPAPQTELRVRHTGTVKWFDEDRGYGFVADDDGGELFLHASCLLVEDTGGLREGTPIEYEVERTERGPQAVDVILLA